MSGARHLILDREAARTNVARAMERGEKYIPEVGDFVLLPKSTLIKGVGTIVGFEDGRAVVQSLTHANITVTVATKGLIVPEYCSDPEHPDCQACLELAIDCARWTRLRLRRRV